MEKQEEEYMQESNELNALVDDLRGKLALANSAPPLYSDEEDNGCDLCFKFKQSLNSKEILIQALQEEMANVRNQLENFKAKFLVKE